jgi:uncharacterized protein (TIGR00297 family)
MVMSARCAIGTAAAGSVALAAYRARSLTADGALAATVVGAIIAVAGGFPAAGALATFFVTSSALSRFKEHEKARRGALAQAKGGQRDCWQVLANGGVAAAAALLGRTRRWPTGTGAFLGALATAGADTWATELGLLAPRPPRLITTLRPVAPGASGGVTLHGLLASIGGALAVGAPWAALQGVRRRGRRRSIVRAAVLTAALAGPVGALVDSLLGATAQAAYWCTRCAAPTQGPVHGRCGQPAKLAGGWAWMTNDVVNALATGAGAAAGVACWLALSPREEASIR